MICLFKLTSLAALAVLSAASLGAQSGAEVRRPNVVFALADDLGWRDPGCYAKASRVPTPHLDRLAGQGMRFTDAHTPSAVRMPTRLAEIRRDD